MQQQLHDFQGWLDLLGYHPQTVKYAPVRLAEWMRWCGDGPKDGASISAFFNYLEQRPNKNRAGALSLATLRNYLSTLHLYRRYLLQTKGEILQIDVQLSADDLSRRRILSASQIRQLYNHTTDTAYGLRARAMLGVFYGCGLRRSEGTFLRIQDIRLDSELVYVQRGSKNYRSRLVPISTRVQQDLADYLQYGRPLLLNGALHDRFFVGRSGRPLGHTGLYECFRRLCMHAGIEPMGLHSLRHSIATHLLQNGVPLKQIARFLGHHSLESTQLYTHLVDVSV